LELHGFSEFNNMDLPSSNDVVPFAFTRSTYFLLKFFRMNAVPEEAKLLWNMQTTT